MKVRTFDQEALTEESKRIKAFERECFACSDAISRFLFHLPTRQILDAITIANYRRNTHELIWEYHKDELPGSDDLDENCVRLQFNPSQITEGRYISNAFGIPGLEISELYEYGYRCHSINQIKDLVVNKLTKQDFDNIEQYCNSLEQKRYMIRTEIGEN